MSNRIAKVLLLSSALIFNLEARSIDIGPDLTFDTDGDWNAQLQMADQNYRVTPTAVRSVQTTIRTKATTVLGDKELREVLLLTLLYAREFNNIKNATPNNSLIPLKDAPLSFNVDTLSIVDEKDILNTNVNIQELFDFYISLQVSNGKKSATFGMTLFGNILQKGSSDKVPDYVKAHKWYTKAANAGDDGAMYSLGELYVKGYVARYIDQEQNYVEGFRWIKMAAEMGNAEAMYGMGEIYSLGFIDRSKDGTPNYDEAQSWVEKAARNGHPEASELMKKFRLLRDYKPSKETGLFIEVVLGKRVPFFVVGVEGLKRYIQKSGLNQDHIKKQTEVSSSERLLGIDRHLAIVTSKAYKVAEDILTQDNASHAKVLVLEKDDPQDRGNHANAVKSVVSQMSPTSTISLMLIKDQITNKAMNYDVINASFTPSEGLVVDFGPLLNLNGVVVISAGNDGRDMHESPHIKALLYDRLKGRAIIAVNIKGNNATSNASNRPGDNKTIQERTLCAVGTDVICKINDTTYQHQTGTSFAAPTISGALALLKEAFPTLTPSEIGDILLETADKEFEILQEGSPNIYIYKDQEPTVKKEGWEYQKFDPKQYGRGILNVEKAYYAAQEKSKP